MTQDNWSYILSYVEEKYIDDADPSKNHRKPKLISRIVTLAASLVILITAVTLTITLGPLANRPFEDGFEGVQGMTEDALQAAYKCDKSIYDIDNVYLTFYYGYISHIEPSAKEYFATSEFDVCVIEKDSKKTHIVRHVDDNFSAEEYEIDTVDIIDENGDYKGYYHVFNHSETVTIPKEMFVNEHGTIVLALAGVSAYTNNEYDYFKWCYFRYDVKDNKVHLYIATNSNG